MKELKGRSMNGKCKSVEDKNIKGGKEKEKMKLENERIMNEKKLDTEKVMKHKELTINRETEGQKINYKQGRYCKIFRRQAIEYSDKSY